MTRSGRSPSSRSTRSSHSTKTIIVVLICAIFVLKNLSIDPSPHNHKYTYNEFFEDHAVTTTDQHTGKHTGTGTSTGTGSTSSDDADADAFFHSISSKDDEDDNDAPAEDPSSDDDTNTSNDSSVVNTSSLPTNDAEVETDTDTEVKVKVDADADEGTFKRYDGVVIATKVLWQNDIKALKHWTCFINHAYNDRMKYDIVVFTTLPWDEENIVQLQKAAAPANLTVAVEAVPLEEQLAAMTKEEVEFLRKRCNVKNATEALTYFHRCTEPGSRHQANLGYSWQAEFRAYHIWKHPAILKYKYMMWLDSDAFVSTHWDVDPIQAMVENDLTILYAGWPYGKLRNDHSVKAKLVAAYGTNICNVKNTASRKGSDTTRIHGWMCNDPRIGANVPNIAGNHHITNLEVFRKDVHQNFLKNFTGDYKFSRKSDDQIAVTIVSLMEQYLVNKNDNANANANANNSTNTNTNTNDDNDDKPPKRSTVWHEGTNGMKLMIAHHNMYDVSKKGPKPKYRSGPHYNLIKGNWTGLEDRCKAIFNK